MVRKSLMVAAISLIALTTSVGAGTAFAHGYGGGGGFHGGGYHGDYHGAWGHGWGYGWDHHGHYGYGYPVYAPNCYIDVTGATVCY